MSTSSATVDLVFRARNMADGAVRQLAGSLSGLSGRAAVAAAGITSAFTGMGGALSNAIGNSIETLASGGSLTEALSGAGIYMAGQLAEQFSGGLIAKIASGGLVAAIAAPLAGVGSAIGGLIAAAIPIGMAALPFILIGALVAAIAVLIFNEEIRSKVFAFVGELVGNIVKFLTDALGALPGIVGDLFGAAWDFVVSGVVPFIAEMVQAWLELPMKLIGLGASILQTIIDGLAGLPGKVADIVTGAFRDLRIDVGPFHITGQGITVDLPKLEVPQFAGGVRNFGGGLAVVGEAGPELVRLPRGSDVIPNGRLAALAGGASAGVTLEGVTPAQLVDLVERGMYFRLRRAGAAR